LLARLKESRNPKSAGNPEDGHDDDKKCNSGSAASEAILLPHPSPDII
jgi:hypothetical protein